MDRSQARRHLHPFAHVLIDAVMRAQGKSRKQLIARWQAATGDLKRDWTVSLSRWFRGRAAMPQVLIDDLAAWLGVDVEQFFRHPVAAGSATAEVLGEEAIVLAPRLGRAVARDSGGGYRTECPGESPVPVPARVARGRGLGAVEVTGDCLLPDLAPGQIAIVAHHEAVPGQIVAVELLSTGECLLKRYAIEDGSIRLRGNEGEGTLYDPEDIDILGPVIGVYTPW